MERRINELLAFFALDELSAIGEDFLKHNVSQEERNALYEAVAL